MSKKPPKVICGEEESLEFVKKCLKYSFKLWQKFSGANEANSVFYLAQTYNSERAFL